MKLHIENTEACLIKATPLEVSTEGCFDHVTGVMWLQW